MLSTTPTAAAVTLDALADDPYPIVAQLRAEEPVAFAPALDRWLVSSRELVLDVLSDPTTFTTDSERSPIRATFGAQMLSTDGEEQRRHRTPYAPTFRPRAVRTDIGPVVREQTRSIIEGMRPGDDLVQPASYLAVSTVLDLVGLTGVMGVEQVRAWYDDLAAALANVVGDLEVAAQGRRAATAFATAVSAGAGLRAVGGDLTAEERVSNTLLVLFGGIETTQSAILNALWALVRHPHVQADVRSGELTVEAVVEESLRWEPAVLTLTRFTTGDCELAGVGIPAGSVVECLVAGANRDPATFTDPDLFDPGRPNAADHLTFGQARHFCLGAHLARLEASAFVGALLEHTPSGLGFAEADPPPPTGHEFRHPPRLHLTW